MYYHGSKSLFKTFDKRKIGQNHHESEDSGFFFTKKKSLAAVFAQSMTTDGHKPGFIYQAELTIANPLIRKIDTDWGWTTADHFDTQCESLLREVRQGKYDAIVLEGTNGDDLVVVLEPEQINLVRVYEGEREVYHRDAPSDTAYPDILGPQAFDPEVNAGTVPFHYDEFSDGNLKNIEATAFGSLFDRAAKEVLKRMDAHSPGDGRHFGRGEEFSRLAFALFCDGQPPGATLMRCRQDCLVAHDFDTKLTLIYDLRKSADSIQALGRRPMVDAVSAVKIFSSDRHRSRPLSHLAGPEDAIQQLLRQTPEYEQPLVHIKHSHHAQLLQFDGSGLLQTPAFNDQEKKPHPDTGAQENALRLRMR